MCRKINQAYTFDFLFFFGELYYTTCIFTTTEYDFCLFVCVSEKDRSGVCEMFQEIIIKKQRKEENTQSVGFTNML